MDGSVGGGGGGCRSVRPAEKEGKGGNGSEEGPALALQVKGGREGTPCRGDWTTLTTTVKQGTQTPPPSEEYFAHYIWLTPPPLFCAGLRYFIQLLIL